jgi:hypothetical protein
MGIDPVIMADEPERIEVFAEQRTRSVDRVRILLKKLIEPHGAHT